MSHPDWGAETTADEVLADVDLTGVTAFITGAASGIGTETARAMAAKGAHIVIAARDQSKADAAAATVREQTGNQAVETILVDLGSQASVRACAGEALTRLGKIDLLINNAGVMACPFGRTADGFETQFGTNHLGHYLLTNLLMPLVEKGSNKRIVNLSSRAHHIDQVHFDDPNYAHREYEKWAAYGQSKTANVLFTVGLEQRLSSRGIHACAVHPGVIGTNLGRHMTEEDMAFMRKRMEASGGEATARKSIPAGAATTCFAATAPELAGKGGVYCEDCHIAPVDDTSPKGGVRSYAIDPEKADRLWALSEQLVGSEFWY